MSKFIARIATAAVIALAGLPVIAVTAANAQPAPARLQMSKLDLSSAKGAAAFNTRVDSIQRRFCADGQKRSLVDAAACRQAVRAEVMEKLSPEQRLALSGQTISVAQR
jgi:UrcA family protein